MGEPEDTEKKMSVGQQIEQVVEWFKGLRPYQQSFLVNELKQVKRESSATPKPTPTE